MTTLVNGHYFKALIFDLYGTLVHIFKRSEYKDNMDAIIAALELEHQRFTDVWRETWEAYPYGDYPSVKARFDAALVRYYDSDDFPRPRGLNQAIKLRNDYIRGQNLQVKEGALDALEWAIEEGYQVGIISNCSTETAVFWKENPIAKFIPDPTLSCVVKLKKPEAEIFLNETNKLGVDPSKCIYVADGDDHELDTAKALGMTTVLFKYDMEDAYRHQPFPENEHSISHFNELPDLIRKLEFRRQG